MPDAFKLLNAHVSVSRETLDRLSLYYNLLMKWQTKVNLVGSDTIANAWERHFLDSLQLLNTIKDTSKKIVDIGSGAGFPGMALAIVGANNVHLVESDAKKIIFLQEVARITKTNITIHHSRIEDCHFQNVDIFISRALAPLKDLFTLIAGNVSHETICLFHKGKNYIKEIEDANEEWSFEQTIIPSVTDHQGMILKLSNIRMRGKYDDQKGPKP